jgi:transcriptional regulator with XRE-family HTH domain
MAKVSAKTATKTDRTIGQNIRKRRLLLGMTQEQLADKLGVTFQQVQKYEKGVNRVGSGRLYKIAEIFEVPIMIFFDGEKQAATSRREKSPYDLLDDPMTLQMLNEFTKIKDRETQRSILTLVERIRGSK